VERELAALDAALAGESVDPDLTGLAELAVAARAARSEPSPALAASLDSRVAEGFPRPPRFVDRVAAPFVALRQRHLLLPALGAVTSVVLVVVVATSLIGGSDSDNTPTLTPMSRPPDAAQEKS